MQFIFTVTWLETIFYDEHVLFFWFNMQLYMFKKNWQIIFYLKYFLKAANMHIDVTNLLSIESVINQSNNIQKHIE